MGNIETIRFSNNESHLQNHLDSQANKSQYIKSLIQQDMDISFEKRIEHYVLKCLKAFGILENRAK